MIRPAPPRRTLLSGGAGDDLDPGSGLAMRRQRALGRLANGDAPTILVHQPHDPNQIIITGPAAPEPVADAETARLARLRNAAFQTNAELSLLRDVDAVARESLVDTQLDDQSAMSRFRQQASLRVRDVLETRGQLAGGVDDQTLDQTREVLEGMVEIRASELARARRQRMEEKALDMLEAGADDLIAQVRITPDQYEGYLPQLHALTQRYEGGVAEENLQAFLTNTSREMIQARILGLAETGRQEEARRALAEAELSDGEAAMIRHALERVERDAEAAVMATQLRDILTLNQRIEAGDDVSRNLEVAETEGTVSPALAQKMRQRAAAVARENERRAALVLRAGNVLGNGEATLDPASPEDRLGADLFMEQELLPGLESDDPGVRADMIALAVADFGFVPDTLKQRLSVQLLPGQPEAVRVEAVETVNAIAMAAPIAHADAFSAQVQAFANIAMQAMVTGPAAGLDYADRHAGLELEHVLIPSGKGGFGPFAPIMRALEDEERDPLAPAIDPALVDAWYDQRIAPTYDSRDPAELGAVVGHLVARTDSLPQDLKARVDQDFASGAIEREGRAAHVLGALADQAPDAALTFDDGQLVRAGMLALGENTALDADNPAQRRIGELTFLALRPHLDVLGDDAKTAAAMDIWLSARLGLVPQTLRAELDTGLASDDPAQVVAAARKVVGLHQAATAQGQVFFDDTQVEHADLIVQAAGDLMPGDPRLPERVAAGIAMARRDLPWTASRDVALADLDVASAAAVLEGLDSGTLANLAQVALLEDRPGENASPVHHVAEGTPLRDRMVENMLEHGAVRAAADLSPLRLFMTREEVVGFWLDLTPGVSAILAVDDLQFQEQGVQAGIGALAATLEFMPVLGGVFSRMGKGVRGLAEDLIDVARRESEGVVPMGRGVLNFGGTPNTSRDLMGPDQYDNHVTFRYSDKADMGPEWWSLADEEFAAVRGYTVSTAVAEETGRPIESVFQSAMNWALRSQDVAEMEHYGHVSQTLSAALEKLPIYEGGPVQRLTDLPSDVFKRMQTVGVYEDDAFLSAAKVYPESYEGKHLLIIEHPLTARDISEAAVRSADQEVLFPPGASFEVSRIVGSRNPDGSFDETKLIVIYLDEVMR